MTDKDIVITIGRYVQVKIDAFHENAVGGGLLYFEVDSQIPE